MSVVYLNDFRTPKLRQIGRYLPSEFNRLKEGDLYKATLSSGKVVLVKWGILDKGPCREKGFTNRDFRFTTTLDDKIQAFDYDVPIPKRYIQYVDSF